MTVIAGPEGMAFLRELPTGLYTETAAALFKPLLSRVRM